MGGLMRRAILMAMVISGAIAGSQVKLIEPADAIRLVGDDGFVFVSAQSADDYNSSHIVGSISMPTPNIYLVTDTNSTECRPLYSCPKEAQKYLQNRGIKSDQMIIIYDNPQEPHAASLYSFFERYGHRKLKLLNGGQDSIKELDPNQPIFDELQAELDLAKEQLLRADETNSSDLAEDLKGQIRSAL